MKRLIYYSDASYQLNSIAAGHKIMRSDAQNVQ